MQKIYSGKTKLSNTMSRLCWKVEPINFKLLRSLRRIQLDALITRCQITESWGRNKSGKAVRKWPRARAWQWEVKIAGWRPYCYQKIVCGSSCVCEIWIVTKITFMEEKSYKLSKTPMYGCGSWSVSLWNSFLPRGIKSSQIQFCFIIAGIKNFTFK